MTRPGDPCGAEFREAHTGPVYGPRGRQLAAGEHLRGHEPQVYTGPMPTLGQGVRAAGCAQAALRNVLEAVSADRDAADVVLSVLHARRVTMRTCDKPGCGRDHYAKGLCRRHWDAKRLGPDS